MVPELTEESSRLAKQSKVKDKSLEDEKLDDKDGYAILLISAFLILFEIFFLLISLFLSTKGFYSLILSTMMKKQKVNKHLHEPRSPTVCRTY